MVGQAMLPRKNNRAAGSSRLVMGCASLANPSLGVSRRVGASWPIASAKPTYGE